MKWLHMKKVSYDQVCLYISVDWGFNKKCNKAIVYPMNFQVVPREKLQHWGSFSNLFPSRKWFNLPVTINKHCIYGVWWLDQYVYYYSSASEGHFLHATCQDLMKNKILISLWFDVGRGYNNLNIFYGMREQWIRNIWWRVLEICFCPCAESGSSAFRP